MSPAELLAVLDPADADALRRIAESLGIDVDEDALPPPLATVVETAAVFRLAANLPADVRRETRVRAACDALGLDARTVMQRWYRWQRAA